MRAFLDARGLPLGIAILAILHKWVANVKTQFAHAKGGDKSGWTTKDGGFLAAWRKNVGSEPYCSARFNCSLYSELITTRSSTQNA